MSRAISPVTGKPYGLAAVCRGWRLARSGVYRSARELVAEGRAQGNDWSLYLGVSSKASGQKPSDDPSWIVESPMEPGGLQGVRVP